MNRLLTIGILAGASLLPLAAAAAGLADPVPVAVPTPVVVAQPTLIAPAADWTGGYVGAQLSYGNATADDLFPGEEYNGALYGVTAGYRYDFGRLVVGGEAQYDWTDISVEGADAESVLRAGVTVGYDVGRVLPYVTAGYAQLSLDDGVTSDEFDGGYYGIGVDYAVSERVMVGAQVLQHRFDLDNLVADAEADLTTFGLRAAYRF